MPPLPPPVNFALDDIIGNQMTLGTVAHRQILLRHTTSF